MNVGLFDEDLPGLGAKCFDFGLFDDLAAAKLLDLTIKVAHPRRILKTRSAGIRSEYFELDGKTEGLRDPKHDRSSLKKKTNCESVRRGG